MDISDLVVALISGPAAVFNIWVVCEGLSRYEKGGSSEPLGIDISLYPGIAGFAIFPIVNVLVAVLVLIRMSEVEGHSAEQREENDRR